ncbi:acyl-CoA dehydrogenase [Rhodoblastus acidophilus]|uniref:Acyl-CoA dehydrogenase n=1 Tax=Candidatus Rhodoblastus alkanivorans TaxID=2954117 RepID=A0ABS9Z342_9HYPH|nr:acyl-CoA dehydrogenase [Candidatus Rhodoblastus alkanivorans]MCI4677297.1 acyl-CoA dehydrogenase [Candidatus Rhodoblastus alkanivorans]MCI4682032.1 acyl-CoA dehydrogenase [Candidatus Rhodoblastus alkanivorans]MDI4643083.1 acyl-CoA dehydrogenase [Rhodoblastus acidophilus]
MTAYQAPIRDMIFAMKAIGGLDRIAALPGNEEVSEDLVEAIFEEARKFAGDILAPLNRAGDKQGCVCKDGVVTTPDGIKQAFSAFCDNGWHAMPAPLKFGGQGLPHLVSTPVLEMWTAANLAFSLCQMLTLGAIAAIDHHGSQAQKDLYLPKMVAGTWTGTMNLTEPQAGSDLAAVRAKAVPDGDAFRITGTKIFITWGENDVADNIIHLVLARLPDAPAGVKGISLFIVPKFLVNADGSLGARNDLICASIEHKLGIHGSPTAVMSFGDKEGAVGFLVGEANRGLEYMFTMMNHARLNVGLEGVAIAERAFQQARDYALQRIQGRPIGAESGAPIAYHPDVKRMLLDMKAKVEAMRALAYFAAGGMDLAQASPDETEAAAAQAMVDLLIPVVKGWCTESAVEIASTGVQVHGGMGYIEETGAAQHFRDARITPIYEGTTAIQANDLVGRKIARDKGAAAERLIEALRATAAELESAPQPEIVALGQALTGPAARLQYAVEWVAATNAAAPAQTAAAGVPLVHQFGITVGFWLLARQAARAAELLGEGGGDAAFLRGKIALAQHFAGHVLPHAEGFFQAATRGAASVAAFDAAAI